MPYGSRPARPLQVVGDDDDRKLGFEPYRSSSTFCVAIGSRALHGSSSRSKSGDWRARGRCNSAMLLATGRPNAEWCAGDPDFLPERGPAQGILHHAVELCARRAGVDARSVRHVVIDRLRKRIRALEDHAHALPQLHAVDAGRENALPVEAYVAGVARIRGSARSSG